VQDKNQGSIISPGDKTASNEENRPSQTNQAEQPKPHNWPHFGDALSIKIGSGT
jgi:hypothetical protein